MSFVAAVLSLGSGGVVGFALGLSGGGGSILAVPLLLYVVGVSDPHVAIGTSALAVAVNAFANAIGHWRSGTVKWPCATVFAGAGAVGAAIGSTLGKLTNGSVLLVLFALAMFAVGAAMLRPRMAMGDPTVRINPRIAGRLVGIGGLTGTISGFLGIGGGFLIVPGIMLGSGMPILNAIGSSLVAVGVFGITTAANYALAGLVAWDIAGMFILGGIIGGVGGMKVAIALASRKTILTRLFAVMVLVVAAYMLVRSAAALLG
ncbi:MAG: sulfite exporter TauE/SafE family protein [Alphaproteobacteria bacterium]|nr:sulfite exporter TauE/SafE family protein [Alphaproteobacteria bacterium]MDE1903163.1 sulfite exporter TauE/SafE family protein [Alphaproteobacteria bacterium]